MRWRSWGLLAAAVIGVAAIAGVTNAALDAGPQSHEARTQAVAATLRCPTCDNLSVADSPSPMARSMRARIAEQLEQGRSPDAVRQWFVARYGPWVLLNPPQEGVSLVVWGAPVAALAFGAGIGVWLLRGRRGRPLASADTDVDGLLGSWRAGELDVPDSPAGERLEAGLRSLDEDRRIVRPGSPRLAAAADEVAAAWHTVQQRTDEPAGDRRPIGWAAGGLVLLTAIAAALPAAIAARDVGDVATGGIPGSDAQVGAEQDGAQAAADAPENMSAPELDATDEVADLLAELDRVAAAEADSATAAEAVTDRLPADVAPNDRLTVGLLALQRDRLAAADALAVSVLQADTDTGRLEAMLLRGLTLTAQGDDAGADWLQRFVDTAPADHPGRPMAEDALAAAEAQS